MSQENVEIVRRAFTAFERDGLAGMLPHFDCEIEWTTTDGHIEPATYRGYEGVLRYLGTMACEIDGIRLEALELIDAGEQVVVTWRVHGRAKLSGACVEMTLTSVSMVCDGKIVRVRNYSDKTQALEAVGLSGYGDENKRIHFGVEANDAASALEEGRAVEVARQHDD